MDIHVVELDAHQGARLGLHFPPVGDGTGNGPIQKITSAA